MPAGAVSFRKGSCELPVRWGSRGHSGGTGRPGSIGFVLRLYARAVAAALLLAGPAAGGAQAAQPAGLLTLVGSNSLANRGMNAALAMADHCAYVGSRNDGAPQVVDVSDPAAPRVVGALAAHPGSTPRELRTVPGLKELAVLFYRLSGGINGIDLYRWDSDCASPTLAGHYDFGGSAPHEFYLWEDPAQPKRVLLFVSMFASATLELQVIDISNPASPARLGGWAVPPAYGHAPLHSIDVSADGRTAYVSLWTGGLIVADTSDFVTGRANPTLRPLTPPAGAFRTSPGNVHSAVPLPGQSRVLTTDERYPAPYGAGCPFGTAHIVDISNPARPVALSTLAVPENQPSACSSATRGTWTSHNPTLTPHLALLTWYSAGLEVFGLDDPSAPVRLAEYRASGVSPVQRDLQLGVTDTMSWSYPVIFKGLVYVVDINQGLLVLRYGGTHEAEVTGTEFLEGNSNISRASAPTAASPSPSATAGSPSPSASPAAVPRSSRPQPRLAASTVAIAVALVALLLALGTALGVRMRRHRSAHSKL